MAPRGINRPGYPSASASSAKRGVFAASPRTPTNINRPGRNDNDQGPNIVMKSKPPVPVFKQPPRQSVFAPSTSSQSRKQYYDQLGGGVAPLADIQNITQKYQRAADIPLFKARTADYQKFQDYVAGGRQGPAPAFSYGPLKGQQILSISQPELTARAPSFGEAVGDFMRGVGDVVGAGAEFFTGGGMLGNILRGIGGFFKPGEPGMAPSVVPPIYSRGGNDQGPMMNTQTQQYQSLNATQQSIYDMLIRQGKSHAEALAQALAQQVSSFNPTNPYYNLVQSRFSGGGIATLN